MITVSMIIGYSFWKVLSTITAGWISQQSIKICIIIVWLIGIALCLLIKRLWNLWVFCAIWLLKEEWCFWVLGIPGCGMLRQWMLLYLMGHSNKKLLAFFVFEYWIWIEQYTFFVCFCFPKSYPFNCLISVRLLLNTPNLISNLD